MGSKVLENLKERKKMGRKILESLKERDRKLECVG